MKNTNYISELTKFLNSIKKPGLYEKQLILRKTWWDTKEENQEELKAYRDSQVKHKSYVYFD